MIITVNDLTKDLISRLKACPHDVRNVPPRRFEALVAELLRDIGCEVQLTPFSRDGGRDILAALATPLGRILALVECKRYAAHRKIGTDIVERFLWTIERKDEASLGIIVTTSFFSRGAKLLEERFRWKLKLRDYDHLQDWIGQYGSWRKRRHDHLWLPKVSLLEDDSDTA